MKIAVIGGGINGIMTAWELCKHHHDVTLFEKNTLMSQTSSASSKLLHGGLRYLENFEFRLVREALRERRWWIDQAPSLAQPIKIYIPIYKQSRRPAWIYKCGLFLYDLLSGKSNLGEHTSVNKVQMERVCPELKSDDLIKGFSYYDGLMDDYKLGLWAVKQAKQYGNLTVLENTTINKIDINGNVFYKNYKVKYDKVINITGPWAHELLRDSNIKSKVELDLVKGSHILVNRNLDKGYLLEVPNERRIFFVIPYDNQTLIGTTEVRQSIKSDIKPTQREIIYLIEAYNFYFKNQITQKNIIKTFSGLRPLIKSSNYANKITREYRLTNIGQLISVFGGKWTTSRQLAKKVYKEVCKKG
jgi:glycerol-3-phosphate dehydrogenase